MSHSVMAVWSASDIPDLRGKYAIVTGATAGLGLETALWLARSGAEVLLTGRNERRGEDALARIRKETPSTRVSFVPMDLANLKSVASFAESVLRRSRALDLLIENAGLIRGPQRETTPDGLELTFAANYLGHFALAAHLMPALLQAETPRLIAVSSTAHRSGRIDFDDLQGERRYSGLKAYAQSKLAMLMFVMELYRRGTAAGLPLSAIGAHPGWVNTKIADGQGRSAGARFAQTILRVVGQPVEQGALPILFAATAPRAIPGGYYGPDGFYEMRGKITLAKIAHRALDVNIAEKLWSESEKLAQLRFPISIRTGSPSKLLRVNARPE